MKSEIRVIPANLLSVDPEIQRPLDVGRVKAMAAQWNDSAIGVLTVSDRGGNSRVVIDGQTRLAALREVAGGDTALTLRCDEYRGLTRFEEAQLFLTHNDRKGIRPADRFRIALVAREEWAVDIQTVLNNHGWRAVGTDSDVPDTKQVTALSAAERIYRRDASAFTATVKALTMAWGHQSSAMSVHAIYGVGNLFTRHEEIDRNAFIAKLRKMRSDSFIGDADMIRRSEGASVAAASYQNAVRIYNRGRSGASRIDMRWGR